GARGGPRAASAGPPVALRLLGLARPGGADPPDGATWTGVESHEAARGGADRAGGTPFVPPGRQTLPHHVGPWARREARPGRGGGGPPGRRAGAAYARPAAPPPPAPARHAPAPPAQRRGARAGPPRSRLADARRAQHAARPAHPAP
ncbi:hypothetical protein DXX98_15510, partial [Janibacter melonis]|nr:hypothetical protein [Janibacter melonis]